MEYLINFEKENPKCSECDKGLLCEFITMNETHSEWFMGLECNKCLRRTKVKKMTWKDQDKFMCLRCGYRYEDRNKEREACPGCLAEGEDERKSYHDDGFIEVICSNCNGEQWMQGTKPVGVCCDCGESFDNEYFEDYVNDKIKELTQQKNNLCRKISALKKALPKQ